MKWFKHMTDSSDDEKLASLLGRHGAAGYGVWWLIMEAVGKQVAKDGAKCEASYPVSYWIRITGIYRHSDFKNIVQSLRDLCLISVPSLYDVCTMSALCPKDVLTISIPNLLKYRDEYTRKSGHTPEVVPPKNKIQNKKKNITPISSLPSPEKHDTPDGLSQELWGEFIAHRKEIKKPMTGLAITRVVKKLADLKAKGYDITAMVDEAIMRGWQDVYVSNHRPDTSKQRPLTSADYTVTKNIGDIV